MAALSLLGGCEHHRRLSRAPAAARTCSGNGSGSVGGITDGGDGLAGTPPCGLSFTGAVSLNTTCASGVAPGADALACFIVGSCVWGACCDRSWDQRRWLLSLFWGSVGDPAACLSCSRCHSAAAGDKRWLEGAAVHGAAAVDHHTMHGHGGAVRSREPTGAMC